MTLSRVAVSLAVFFAASVYAAAGAPGDSLARERARLAAIAGVGPLTADPVLPGRYVARGGDGWTITVDVRGGAVEREAITLMPTDGSALATAVPIARRVFGAALAADIAGATIVGIARDGPAASEFRRGARAAYILTDDTQNRIHALAILPLDALDGEMRVQGAAPQSGRGDALFVLEPDGSLRPVALFVGGAAVPFDGNLPIATTNALAAEGSVRVLTDGQTIDTLAARASSGAPALAEPLPWRLRDGSLRLASPTLGGFSEPGHLIVTEREREAAVAIASRLLGTSPAHVTVRSIGAFTDHGSAVALTAERRGTGKPHTDDRLFAAIADPAGSPRVLLAVHQTVRVTEPLLDEVGEYFLGTVPLRNGQLVLVTHAVGYDADAFPVYVESGGTFRRAGTAPGLAR